MRSPSLLANDRMNLGFGLAEFQIVHYQGQ